MAESDILQIAEIDIALAQKNLDQLEKDVGKMASSSDKEFQKLGKSTADLAKGLRSSLDAAKETGKVMGSAFGDKVETFSQFEKEVRKLSGSVKTLAKDLSETSKTDALKEALNVQEADQRLKSLNATLNSLFGNSIPQARQFAGTLQDAAANSRTLFDQGKISAEQFNKEMAGLNTRANRATREFADGFGEEVPQAINRSQVSLFKLGTTFDRLGQRGAGGAIRIVDALKGINPALIVAAVGIAGLVIGVQKLGQAFIAVANKAKEFFIQVLKDSVDTSKRFELLERQFLNIFDGSEEDVSALFDFILQKSVQLGTDLSEISKLLIPEVGSLEELDKAFNLISTLQFSFGRTTEEVFRAIKQGSADLFRSLQEQFGLLGTDINRIKELQEIEGPLTGLLTGIEEFLNRTGRSFDVFENSLARIQGSFEALRTIALRALGEPIRNEIAEQLQKILDFVEENEAALEALLFGVGDAVSNVLATIGNIGDDLFEGDINFEDLLDILERAEGFAVQLVSLADDIVPDDIGTIPEAFLTALEFAERTVLIMRVWLEIGRAVAAQAEKANQDIREFQDTLFRNSGGLLGQPLEEPQWDGEGPRPPTSGERAVGFLEGIGADFSDIEESIKLLDEQQAARREAIKAIQDQSDATLDSVDAQLQENDALQEYNRLADEAAEAAKEIADAKAEAEEEGRQRVEDLNIELGRRTLDLEIEFARERREIWQDLVDDLQKSYQDFLDDVADAQTDANRKLEDIDIEYGRRLADLDESQAQDRLDIEKDFQDKLEDIRRRFDFDASEAIRNNDAVALRRIRRRMQFELDEARRNRDKDIRDANDKAKERREDLKKWLDREVEDAALAEARKEEDLLLAFERRNEALRDQYDLELRDQQIKERERVEDLKRWREQEYQDLLLWWDRKIAAIRLKYEEELAVIRQYEAAKLEIIAGAAGGTSTLPGQVPGPAPSPGGGTGGVGSTDLEALRQIALDLARRLGLYYLVPSINTMTNISQLQALIETLRARLAGGAGGGVGNNAPVTSPTGPAAPNNFTPPPSPAQAGFTGGGRTNNIQMMLTDPSQLSQVQIAMIRQVVQEEILADVLV